VKDRQLALEELVKAIAEFRKVSDQPLTLRGGDYARAVQALNSRARDSSKHNCTHCVACRHMCFTLLLSSYTLTDPGSSDTRTSATQFGKEM
jgi:hypothetical protein